MGLIGPAVQRLEALAGEFEFHHQRRAGGAGRIGPVARDIGDSGPAEKRHIKTGGFLDLAVEPQARCLFWTC